MRKVEQTKNGFSIFHSRQQDHYGDIGDNQIEVTLRQVKVDSL